MDRETMAAEILGDFQGVPAAIILGTGLGVMEKAIDVHAAVPYEKIPGFPVSTVTGHAGRLLKASLGGKDILVMSGRCHLYEGYGAEAVTFPIRVFRLLGIQNLLISNAAGGLRKDLVPGSAMLITDHINLTGTNPLIGPNRDALGPRFPDMTQPYSRRLADLARKRAREKSMELHEGVYIQVPGPSLETAAETRMLQRLGAHAVGMSTVMEVIQAVHCGMEVLAVSAITNSNDPDDYVPAPLETILQNAEKAGPVIAELFRGVLAEC
ncbi:MAG TPA: purine-nucleoside phosphorylase [Deltaproteobacteria bacterium]|nr:purine-nucleoside phosphorylase [Deltaproteobacteria bacterium]HQI80720.1 purine-nucleoside phosphorylase [Deltaproteobacteria bacterium]